MAETTQVLGIVAIDNKGAYSADAYYEKLNVVTYQGSSYCAKTNVHNVLPTNSDYWQLVAEKGDKGDTGDKGETGNDGYTPVRGTDYWTDTDITNIESTLSSDVNSEVTSQLSLLTSATPLAASSVAEMTNTTRIYVNTTDGHWYWYDGEEWQDGGVYQATEDSDTVGILKELVDETSECEYNTINKSNELVSLYGSNGYINLDSGAFTSLATYRIYYFTMPFSGYVWFDETTDFTQIGVYGDELFDTNDVIYLGGTSRDTLPDVNHKVSVKKGMVVAVCIGSGTSKNFSLHLPTRVVLSEKQMDYIDEEFDIADKVSKNGTNEVTMNNSEFIDVVNINIFDGNYIDGYAVAGSETFIYESAANRYNLVRVPVKPNTNYTILATPNNDTSNFFKYATATKNLADGETFDGSILQSIASRKGDFIANITTGANDHYLYCYGINYQDPNGEQFYQIYEGTIDHFTTNKYSDYYGVFNDKIKQDAEDIQKNIKIQKTDSTHFKVYVPSNDGKKVVRYDFIKYLKTWESLEYLDGNGQTQVATNIESCNYWNNIYVYDNKGNYIAQGHSNFITKPTGSRYHVGNGHGNEVMTYYSFLADGVDIDFDNMDNGEIVECCTFRFILKSKIYKCSNLGDSNTYSQTSPALDTSGNPIVNFTHYMEMLFKIGNDITINNRLYVKQNNITFEQCHGAMLECYFGDFTDVICNNKEVTRNIVASNGDITVPADVDTNFTINPAQKCNTVEMYGGRFYIRQDMMQDEPSRNTKSNVFFNFYNNRLKCYFQPVTASYGKQSGETLETFNTGDVISVTDHRVIELI